MGLADAVVAVAIYPLTWVPIMQVYIGWTVRTCSCAEFWEVAGVAGAPACSSCGLQLKGEGSLQDMSQEKWKSPSVALRVEKYEARPS